MISDIRDFKPIIRKGLKAYCSTCNEDIAVLVRNIYPVDYHLTEYDFYPVNKKLWDKSYPMSCDDCGKMWANEESIRTREGWLPNV